MITAEQRDSIRTACQKIRAITNELFEYCSELDQLEAANWTVSSDIAGIKSSTVLSETQKNTSEQTYLDLITALSNLVNQLPSIKLAVSPTPTQLDPLP